MKMRRFLAYGIVAFAIMATSCEKDDDNPDEGTFSPLTVEQNKENIETDGIKMLDEIKDLENEPAIEASASFIYFMDNASGDNFKKVDVRNTIAFSPIYAAADFDETGMKGMLKSVQVNPAEDPETIQAMYDSLVGVYDWNPTVGDWDYTQTGTIILFNFPATETGTTNNASYSASYVGYTGVNPIDDYDGDLPQNVATSLKVDGNEISALTVDVVYNSDGIPTSIETTFTLGAFEWYASASNANNAAFATEVSFKHSGDIILKFTLDAAGNWSEANVEANYEVVYYGEWYDQNTGEWHYKEISESEIGDYEYYWSEEEFDIHKVIKNGNASFQAMNMKIVGAIDVENFGTLMISIDDQYDWDTQEEEMIDAQVDALNQYVSLSLRYADNDEIIALVEAYPISEEYIWINYEWNEATGEYTEVEVTEMDYWIDFRFVFADGSKVDAETYFSEGFDDLINQFEDYLTELENTYDI